MRLRRNLLIKKILIIFLDYISQTHITYVSLWYHFHQPPHPPKSMVGVPLSVVINWISQEYNQAFIAFDLSQLTFCRLKGEPALSLASLDYENNTILDFLTYLSTHAYFHQPIWHTGKYNWHVKTTGCDFFQGKKYNYINIFQLVLQRVRLHLSCFISSPMSEYITMIFQSRQYTPEHVIFGLILSSWFWIIMQNLTVGINHLIQAASW